ncbi:hypothetical protein F5Y05DRAFT_362775 [Hypoxylon sp. FL0543]|nr:hypothetical protein F5Y05DRAFT_362775 [Hypoxylon sp. FL0543]
MSLRLRVAGGLLGLLGAYLLGIAGIGGDWQWGLSPLADSRLPAASLAGSTFKSGVTVLVKPWRCAVVESWGTLDRAGDTVR